VSLREQGDTNVFYLRRNLKNKIGDDMALFLDPGNVDLLELIHGTLKL